MDKLTGIDFSDFTIAHIFADPANYEIKVTATDNEGASFVQTISVDVDFPEASLENIKPNLFKQSDNEYLILTINLHTYQESQQDSKFHLIADVIGKMDIDFITFQECAQHKLAPLTEGIIREDNMALIITEILKEKYNADYNFIWHWAHYGWTVWEEGVAVLSKYPLMDSEDRYVSSGTSTGSITTRKVIYGLYQMTNGRINIFSAHTHWRTSETDEEQNNQINNIKSMVIEKELLTTDAVTFVCGDFNVNPTSDDPWSEGYYTMMENGEYTDTFLEIYPEANNKPAQSIYNTIGGDFPGRIDYIFMKNNARYEVLESQIIFTDDMVGMVSDHFGVLTKVRDNEE
jgi:maltose 6'-phosphate phosphatase